MTDGKIEAADGTEIAWTARGAGQTPVVLIHGIGDDRSLWSPIAQVLADEMGEHFRVLTYDLRGHGASGFAPGTGCGAETLADDLGTLLAHHGPDPALVVGFSLGGAVALWTALRHPGRVRAVAVLNANGVARDLDEERALVGAMAAADGEGDGSGEAPIRPLPPHEVAFIEKVLGRLSPTERMVADAARRCSVRARADELRLPVWLVASDRDPGFMRRSEEFLPLLPNGRRLVIEGARHAIMRDQPEALTDVLRAFLGEHGPTGTRASGA